MKNQLQNCFFNRIPKQAPEAIKRGEYSEKTDVWSFGITVIEILTRKPPYPYQTGSEVISLVGNGQLPIEWNEKWVNEEMKEFLIEKCFAFDPNQRYSFKVYGFEKTLMQNLLHDHFIKKIGNRRLHQ